MALIDAVEVWAQRKNNVSRNVMAPNLYAGSSVRALSAVTHASRRKRLIRKAQDLREVFVEGTPAEAVEAARIFTRKYPKLPEGLAVLAEALQRDRQIGKAVEASNHAETLGLREAPARKLRAVICEADGRMEEAITEATLLTEIDDDTIRRTALLARARLKILTGKRVEALQDANAAIDIDHGMDADRIRAYIYHRRGELKAAFGDLTVALAFHTGPEAHAAERVDILRYRALISDLRADHDQARTDRAEARSIAARIPPPRPIVKPGPENHWGRWALAAAAVLVTVGVGALYGFRNDLFVPDSVPVGTHPLDVAVSPDGRSVYVVNTGSGTVSVVDPMARRVTATISVGLGPHHIRMTPDGRRLYVARSDRPGLVVVDTASHKVSTTKVSRPAGDLVLSRDGRRAYVIEYVTDNFESGRIAVLDTRRNTVVATITQLTKPDHLAISPDGQRVYVTHLLGNDISVIDTERNDVVGAIPLGVGASGILASLDGRRLYVGGSEEISVVDTASSRVVGHLSDDRMLSRMVVNKDGHRLYAAGDDSVEVAIIDTIDGRVIRGVRIGKSADGMALSPDGSRLYVADWVRGRMAIMNTSTASKAG